MKLNKFLILSLLGTSGMILTSCGKSGEAGQKPVIWFNRQPSNPDTGELDNAALTFNDYTAYVGFDAAGGGAVQGQMIVDYIKANINGLDKNGDRKLGYVLCIGDQGHNDSQARTKGIREALGTWDGGTAADKKKVGSIKVGETTYEVVELAAQEMKEGTETWNATKAAEVTNQWYSELGNKIDLCISNNDGMGMGAYNKWAKAAKVPTFGYDANTDAVQAIGDSTFAFAGTVTQHAEVQAYATLRAARNAIDGMKVTDGDFWKTGFDTADDAGGKLSSEFKVSNDKRNFYALNGAVTKENQSKFSDATAVDSGIKQLDSSKHPEKKVWINLYNAGDNFLSSTYKPLLEKYAKLLNLKLTFNDGDGTNETSVSDKLADGYDAYCINLVRTNSAKTYTDKIANYK